MLSSTFRKPVLIDFGLSVLVEEVVGEATWSNFRGNLNFCSDEMTKCFALKKPMYVDLYYNDVVGLTNSLKSIN